MKRYLRSVVLFVVICIFTVLVHAVCNAASGAEPWKGNKIGISDVPPPPFTLVTVDMNKDTAKIGCWGRTYTLAATGLPVQIRSKDADLLAAPVRLIAESEGAPVEWKSIGMRLVKSSQVQVIVEGTAQSSIGQLDWKCTAEYDGLLRYDLVFTPIGEASLNTLTLRFPLKTEHARLNWRHEHYWPINHYQGALPPGEGVLIRGDWRPYIWLGDEDRGMAVFTETPEPWQEITGKGEAFRLERNGERVEVIWPFANGNLPWKLTKPWKLTFGIEATPVKDTTGWRRWRTSRRQTRDVVWTNNRNEPPGGPGISRVSVQDSNPAYTKHYGYPESADPKYYRSLVDKAHAMGYKFIPYFLPKHLGEFAPEAKYLPEWRRDKSGGNDVNGIREFIGISGGKPVTATIHNRNADGSDDTFTTGPVNLQMSFTDPYISVAPTPEWIDFMVWKCDQWVRDLNADGLYADLVLIDEGANPAAGLGYERDGVRYPTWPFFANRQLQQRLYTMLKQMNKDTFYMIHISRDLYIPYLAFCDGYLAGEGHSSPTPPASYAGKDYDELMPLDVVQAYFMGQNYGVPGYLCTQLGTRKDPVASEKYMISMSLLHDFGLRHDGENIAKVYRAMDDFGIVDAEFFPYWRNSNLVGGQTEEIKASVYRKPKGESLVVVSNLTRKPQRLTLTVNWDNLQPSRPLKVVDALTKEPISGDAKSLTLEVEPLGFRLLRIDGMSHVLLMVPKDESGSNMAQQTSGPKLIASYNFQEGAGTVLKDSSGNMHDGAILNGQWVKTEVGRPALQFTETTRVKLNEDTGWVSTGDLTILAWVKLVAKTYPDGTTNWCIVDCEQLRQTGFIFRIDGTGRLYYRSNQAGGLTEYYGNRTVSNGAVTQVGFVKSGGTVVFYINGLPGTPGSVKDPVPATGPLYIGSPTQQSFSGQMYEVKIYGKALSNEEILKQFDASAANHGK